MIYDLKILLTEKKNYQNKHIKNTLESLEFCVK